MRTRIARSGKRRLAGSESRPGGEATGVVSGVADERDPGTVSESPAIADGSEAAASVMRRLFGRDLLYFLLWGAQMGAATLITPIITRMLGAERFGLVAVSMSVMQLLVAFGSLGLDNALQRQYAVSGEEAARRVVTLAIVCAIAITAIAYVTGPVWARTIGFEDFPLALRYAVVWAGATAVTDASLALLRSQDKLHAFSVINLTQTAVSQLVSIALLLLVRRSADEYLLGQALTQFVAAGLALSLARPLPIRWRDRALIRMSLGYALPLVPATVSAFVMTSSNRLFVQHDLGTAAVARFTIPYNIGTIPLLLLWALTVMWMPRMFAVSDEGTRSAVLAQSRDSLYGLIVPMLVAISAAAPLLLHIWAPPSLITSDSAPILVIMLVTTVPYSAYLSRSRVLMAAGLTGPVAVSTAAGAGLNVVLNLVLIPPFGIVGSALATLVAYVSMHLVLIAFASRSPVLPAPKRRLLVAVNVSMAFAAAMLLLPSGWGVVVFRTLIVLAAGTAAAAITAVLMGRAEQFHLAPIAHRLDALFVHTVD